MLNYNLFAAVDARAGSWGLGTGALSATLDARAFSPLGTLSQTAIVRMPSAKGVDVLRLDSDYVRSDPGTMVTYTAGDMVSRGFLWTRPIRMGGIQIRRNFGLRPDIITEPLPAVSGSAAVPSTVEVFVNNLKTFSRSIDAGPYRITDIPVTTGNGEARVVLHDAAGHTVETTVPYYVSPSLLRPGLSDFSLEAGLPRLGYATPSDHYVVGKPAISASLRRGTFDWLTLEGHAEANPDIANAGLGMVMRAGTAGVVSMAMSGSRTKRPADCSSVSATRPRLAASASMPARSWPSAPMKTLPR